MASPAELVQQGYCVSHGEQHPEYWAVAVPFGPVLNFNMVVFNAVVHQSAIRQEAFDREFGPRLVAMVHQIKGHVSR